MRSWNIEEHSSLFRLMNASGTLIRKHGQVPFGVITSVLAQLEELDFPIDYTEGLDEIYFTYLKRGLSGDYDDGAIRLACNKDKLDDLYLTLIHEIGHHVDLREWSVCSDREFLREWGQRHWLFFDNNSHVKPSGLTNQWDGPGEYFAIGFERYYGGLGLDEKAHPELIRVIREAERNRIK